jgi:SAM-dependent methyltransferase
VTSGKNNLWTLARRLAAPITALNQHRIERHYRLTLEDSALAERWARHYLGGLPLPAGARVLDYGCGRGRGTGLLLQNGFAVTAIDIRAHEWWQRLPRARFVLVETEAARTPFDVQASIS